MILLSQKDTEIWLAQMEIMDYCLRLKGEKIIVDVNKSVNLTNKKLKSIPVQFGVIRGNFWCANNKLTNLLGAPHTVMGDFNCSDNKLYHLKHLPREMQELYFTQNLNVKILYDDIKDIHAENVVFSLKKVPEYFKPYKVSGSINIDMEFALFKKMIKMQELNENLNMTLKDPHLKKNPINIKI